MSRPIIQSEDGLYNLLGAIVKQAKKDVKSNNESAGEAEELLENLRIVFSEVIK